MDNVELVENWQKKIIAICQKKLGRNLTSDELAFVKSRAGFMALEAIEDTVNSDITSMELETYLNSDRNT